MKIANRTSKIINDESNRRERSRAIKNAYASIILKSGINASGRELVLLIGEGGEHNNREALMYWIDVQTEDISAPFNCGHVDLLMTVLESTVQDKMDENWTS